MIDIPAARAIIQNNESVLGIELGSTQIKAVLTTPDCQPLATGSHVWENQYLDDTWTYSLTDVWQGIQSAYQELVAEVQTKYHVPLQQIKAIGVSAMMHGYLAFDHQNQQLVPFRTWRNNTTQEAAKELTKLFGANIPLRWSVAHLYQAILQQEPHVEHLTFMTTLAGYVHWQLTGEKVLGVGDASGMFPLNSAGEFDPQLLQRFAELPAVKNYAWHIEDILPRILKAGQTAGYLTIHGAQLLDSSGTLQAGSLLAPPEGDAGTGMISTNSVRVNTGNVSVGTSAFAMVVLNKQLKTAQPDIDLVATPAGEPVAMVHINNCSSDINAWAQLFAEFAQRLGSNLSADQIYETLFLDTEFAQADAGGLVNYSYLSGENITQVDSGRPLFVRTPTSKFNLPNFMLAQLYAAFAPLKLGMDILFNEEKIKPQVLIAQGGLFKTPVVGQQILANALNTPISIMENASLGGPWGMAVLAQYATSDTQLSLEQYLDQEIFGQVQTMTLSPETAGVHGYEHFIKRYQQALSVERAAQILN
ncbi:xylulokinase [Bombilactobacillus thymidiniphilus]|uniref:FGGY-family carbohydrate kinase n=1 Tax=Bombilactobacillus thymidiniphilus TaxID=2923363 RepID=A0ABY4PBF6_9LACO|nr:FGGY-family carbohydrate kinase [Bombilactobacillus thymidiniphilus]UQS83103.1 FGGY-family carbohydrate kinase [Bombilactobacillus thymidiniphilus]